jgi:hypothetical protein
VHESWRLAIPGPAGDGRLREGFFTDLLRAPFHNRGRGGLTVSRESHGCSNSVGWIAVDQVAYEGDELTRLDLRFEHRCAEFGTPQGATWGELHYDVDEVPEPLSPQPIPEGFWAPEPGSTPASGTFLYLQSQTGDPVGRGQSWLYEAPTAQFNRYAATTSVGQSGRPSWSVQVRPSGYDDPLVVGYYPRAAAWGSVSGWFSADGNGTACSRSISDYVVDDVAYDAGGGLSRLLVRFVQRCNPGDPPLRGVLRWEAPAA